MQDVNVLIAFCSDFGWAERLALAAGLGAVQGRANIRFRQIKTAEDKARVDASRAPGTEDYIAPREVDVEWADALIWGAPAHLDPSSEEWTEYFHLLGALRSRGKLEGKLGAAFSAEQKDAGNDSTVVSLCGAMAHLGLMVVLLGELNPNCPLSEAAALENVRLQGRRVAEIARALKKANRPAPESAVAAS